MAGNIGKAVKLYGYARTVKSKSDYATKMNRLSNQIFGEVARPTSQEGMQIVERLSAEPHEKQQYRVEFYPAIEEATELMRILREYGLYRDEAADFKEDMQRTRELRGKPKIRSCWKDGVRPVKTVEFRYDD
jgi:small subunit ribosomal protein S33